MNFSVKVDRFEGGDSEFDGGGGGGRERSGDEEEVLREVTSAFISCSLLRTSERLVMDVFEEGVKEER